MKILRLLGIIPITLATIFLSTKVNLAETPVIQINRNLPTNPIVLNGKSGGTVKSSCGNITATPNQVIQVTESLPYLRLTVESQGQPTLLIDGPGGRFCVLADSYSGNQPEVSGYWRAGKYSLFVGQSSPEQYNYTLSISKNKK